MTHNFITPANPMDSFSIWISKRGWVPGHHQYQNRTYYITYEIGRMLVKKNVIRRRITSNWVEDANENKVYFEVLGVEQVRKWIAQDHKRSNRDPNKRLIFKNRTQKSKKYGWAIPKQDFADFFYTMTGEQYFIESEFADCLLHEENMEYIEFLESEFSKKLIIINQDLETETDEKERNKLIRQKEFATVAMQNYRKKWLEVAVANKVSTWE